MFLAAGQIRKRRQMKWGYLIELKKDGIVKEGTTLQNLSHTYIQNPIFEYKDGVSIVILTEELVFSIREMMGCTLIQPYL